MADLDWTGERLVTSLSNLHGTIEHLHRYALAIKLTKGKKILLVAKATAPIYWQRKPLG